MLSILLVTNTMCDVVQVLLQETVYHNKLLHQLLESPFDQRDLGFETSWLLSRDLEEVPVVNFSDLP